MPIENTERKDGCVFKGIISAQGRMIQDSEVFALQPMMEKSEEVQVVKLKKTTVIENGDIRVNEMVPKRIGDEAAQ